MPQDEAREEKRKVFLLLPSYFFHFSLKVAGGYRLLSVCCGLKPRFQTLHELCRVPLCEICGMTDLSVYPFYTRIGIFQRVAAQMVTAMGACNGLIDILGSWPAVWQECAKIVPFQWLVLNHMEPDALKSGANQNFKIAAGVAGGELIFE